MRGGGEEKGEDAKGMERKRGCEANNNSYSPVEPMCF